MSNAAPDAVNPDVTAKPRDDAPRPAQAAATLQQTGRGMSRGTARAIEYGIIALCLFALFAVFQPWSMGLFTWGAPLVVLGGLAFNLVPFCRPGVPARALLKVVGIIAAILVTAALLGMLTAQAFVIYLESLR